MAGLMPAIAVRERNAYRIGPLGHTRWRGPVVLGYNAPSRGQVFGFCMKIASGRLIAPEQLRRKLCFSCDHS